jgi:superfamily I DNA/RNA helicase
VNSLVEDLSLDLYGLSEVRTLHGYARSLISEMLGSAKLFPKLSAVIKEDAKLLFNRDVDFDKLFHDRDDESADVKFYSQRRKYYDNHYGHSDVIFAAVRYLERHPEKVPAYEQVLVDEFQDFNQLEVSLIDLLSEQSPVLIAGDDDQALYDFKHASAKHIREKHGAQNADYASFSLPYCSRCTRVIVDAINDVLSGAAKDGNLTGRIGKEYWYFDCPSKDEESARYPKIVYRQMYAKQIPWFIETEIDKIARERRSKFSVLIISPTGAQSRSIAEALREKGFENVAHVERQDRDVTLLDGLGLLLEDGESNLGWRIVSARMVNQAKLKSQVKQIEEDEKPFKDITDAEVRTKTKVLLAALRKVTKDEAVDAVALEDICKSLGIDAHDAARQSLKERAGRNSPRAGKPAIRKIPIQTTTVQSSKGLAEDYVFITHFDDQYFLKQKGTISDRDICSFLVALTRARQKVFLVSSHKTEPSFLKWIKRDRLDVA